MPAVHPPIQGEDRRAQHLQVQGSFWAPLVSLVLVPVSSAVKGPAQVFQGACATPVCGRWLGFPSASCSLGGGCSHISPPSVPSVPGG